MFQRYLAPFLIAAIVVVATLMTISPNGSGPGVTCDELYYVHKGKELVTAWRMQGLDFFSEPNINRNFNWPSDGPPTQAPLGCWLIGWTHYLFDPAPDDPSVLTITTARFAPALAYGVLVLLVGFWMVYREGAFTGAIAALATAMMPRVFGHAHLAALDMFTALFFVAAVIALIEAARSDRIWAFALAGVVWGLCLLTRLHGFLLIPPAIAWLVWRVYRLRRGGFTLTPEWQGLSSQRWWWHVQTHFLPCVIAWLAAGMATLFVGWPWLWISPLVRLQQYFSTGMNRQSLHVFYWGQMWSDHNVPWHYPWVMVAVTIPAGLLILGFVGFWAVLRSGPLAPDRSVSLEERESSKINPSWIEDGPLISGVMGFVLLVFSWPGSHVYDGERLFLMVFPLWALWAALGVRWLADIVEPKRHAVQRQVRPGGPKRFLITQHVRLKVDGPQGLLPPERMDRIRTHWRGLKPSVLLGFMIIQGIGLILYFPCHLCYYNLLVGGLAGAERLGFEVTYWGDTVRHPILQEAARLAPGAEVFFAPSLAPFQTPAVSVTSEALRASKTILIPYEFQKPNHGSASSRYAIVYNRRADLLMAQNLLKQGKVIKEYANQGVWLARLLELPPLDASGERIKIEQVPRKGQ